MIEINLLAWCSQRLSRRLLIGLAIGCLVFISTVVGGCWVYYQRMQHHLSAEQDQRAQLQREIAMLRAQKIVLPDQSKQLTQRPCPIAVKPRYEPLQHKAVLIHYAKAAALVDMFKNKANALLSKHGRVIADRRTNRLWFEDTDARIKIIMRMIKQLDTPSQQIVIEARLVNMNQESARDLGIRLGLVAPNQTGGNTDVALSSTGGRLGVNLAATPLEASAATLGFTEALAVTQRLLDMELSALESAGRAKVIASPRLVTSNQVAALIESGEDIPYQEFAANGTTSVAFKKAVLRLKVVPHITAEGELMMSLVINQDSDSGKRVQGVPIIATKAIETHILVHSGQTVVLGGIYQQDQNRQAEQIPLLGDIPWIGALFKRKQIRVRHESLLIFITPRIVRRTKMLS